MKAKAILAGAVAQQAVQRLRLRRERSARVAGQVERLGLLGDGRAEALGSLAGRGGEGHVEVGPRAQQQRQQAGGGVGLARTGPAGDDGQRRAKRPDGGDGLSGRRRVPGLCLEEALEGVASPRRRGAGGFRALPQQAGHVPFGAPPAVQVEAPALGEHQRRRVARFFPHQAPLASA